MWDRLEQIDRRYEELNGQIAMPEVTSDQKRLQVVAQERAGIEKVVTKYRQYKRASKELEDVKSMRVTGVDDDMAALVKQEIGSLETQIDHLFQELRLALLPKDANDDRDIIMEIRAGAGGDEAGLFAADLFRMYSRYAQAKRWKIDIIDSGESGIGGFREIIFEIAGKGAFNRLKYERGTHRVQRVPATESSGRVHTSTATVAVLPEAKEVDVSINPDDLKMDLYHSGGAGGQNVNKVATAVRITHLPTGMVVICQDERSQLRNRTKAMAVLRARLMDIQQRQQEEEMTRQRRSQVGTGDRAEKIRTYNFSQNRVSDHRIDVTFHNLSQILEGGLDELIDTLATSEETRQLGEGPV